MKMEDGNIIDHHAQWKLDVVRKKELITSYYIDRQMEPPKNDMVYNGVCWRRNDGQR